MNSLKRRSYCHIETSQLICYANQLIGFYMMATLAFNESTFHIADIILHKYDSLH